jgi:hypothetical protein
MVCGFGRGEHPTRRDVAGVDVDRALVTDQQLFPALEEGRPVRIERGRSLREVIP